MDKLQKLVILAVAGSGKTYTICNDLDFDKRNLILAFTHQNVKNIINEIEKNFSGLIPEKTYVMTFDSFVYRYIVNPYLPTIYNFYNVNDIKIKGVTLNPPPAQTLMNGKYRIRNKNYFPKGDFRHYYNNNYYLYLDCIFDLILSIRIKNINFIKKICTNLNLLFDNIFIDEFQDYREDRYKLLINLSKNINKITMVGDYYQHSVSGTNNSGVPFKNGKKEITYSQFIKELENYGFLVDNELLQQTRRCGKEVANFIAEKLKINFFSHDNHEGKVIVVNENADIDSILKNDDIIKLVYNKSDKTMFNSINWSYSKGDTYEDVCVILTKDTDKILDDSFDCNSLSTITKNKLYVAMTRPKHNLYLISSKKFKEYVSQGE